MEEKEQKQLRALVNSYIPGDKNFQFDDLELELMDVWADTFYEPEMYIHNEGDTGPATSHSEYKIKYDKFHEKGMIYHDDIHYFDAYMFWTGEFPEDMKILMRQIEIVNHKIEMAIMDHGDFETRDQVRELIPHSLQKYYPDYTIDMLTQNYDYDND